MEKERKYNIDLLRIISIILIVASHYIYHGNIVNESNSIINIFLGLLVSIGGKLGANIFILISGYFFIENKLKISKVIKMDFKVIIYSLLIYFILVFSNCIPFDIKDVIKSLFPNISGLYWFFTAFMGLYIVSPILNYIIRNLKKEELRNIVLIGFILLSIIPTVTSFDPLYSDFIWFIYIYLLGGYIRLYYEKMKCDRKYYFILFANLIITWILTLILFFTSKSFTMLQSGVYHFTAITSSTIVLSAIIILLIFKNIDIKGVLKKRIILKITPHIFYAYIIHDNPFVRNILWKKVISEQICNSSFMFLNMILVTLLIFIVCIIIDLIIDVFINIFNFKKFDDKLLKYIN